MNSMLRMVASSFLILPQSRSDWSHAANWSLSICRICRHVAGDVSVVSIHSASASVVSITRSCGRMEMVARSDLLVQVDVVFGVGADQVGPVVELRSLD